MYQILRKTKMKKTLFKFLFFLFFTFIIIFIIIQVCLFVYIVFKVLPEIVDQSLWISYQQNMGNSGFRLLFHDHAGESDDRSRIVYRPSASAKVVYFQRIERLEFLLSSHWTWHKQNNLKLNYTFINIRLEIQERSLQFIQSQIIRLLT